MFDLIAGLPLHALVVHAVVVLVPLTAIGAVAIALVPRWNRRFGVLVVGGAVIGVAAAFVAVESGEALASRVGTPEPHYSIARWLPWFALGLLVAVVLMWLVDINVPDPDRRRAAGRGPGRSGVGKTVAVLTVLVAVAATWWTVRTGDSGARAVWGPIVVNTTPGSQPVG